MHRKMQNKMKMIYFQSVQKGASKATCFVSYPHIPVQWIIQVIDTLILNYIMKYFTILFRFSVNERHHRWRFPFTYSKYLRLYCGVMFVVCYNIYYLSFMFTVVMTWIMFIDFVMDIWYDDGWCQWWCNHDVNEIKSASLVLHLEKIT